MYNRFKKNKTKTFPTYNHNFFNIFNHMKENIKNKQDNDIIKNISVVINGRLGNHLFQIISCWAYAKKYNINFSINKSYEKNFQKYYNYFFNKIELNQKHINYTLKSFHPYASINQSNLFNINNNILINSYLQNSNNFNEYRQEILNLFFNITSVKQKNNNFFIHIRVKDFLSSPLHNINMDNYYKKAIQYLYSIPDKLCVKDTLFHIVSDDIEYVKNKEYLKLLPQENIIFIDNTEYDEIKTLELCSNCCSGAIIGHSTFGWWGAYIINCDEKIIVCPNKFLKSNYDFSGLYLDYKVINV